MDDFSRFPGDSRGSGGGLQVRHLLIIGLFALVVIAVVLWMLSRPPVPVGEGQPPKQEVSRVPEGSRTVMLYFADSEEPVIYGEAREVAVGRRLDEQVRQVIDALIAGPGRERGISAIPKGTQLLSVLLDDAAATLYLDFSSELVAAHPGGSAAEYCTVAAIVKTVAENFPEIAAVQLLVDGSQVDTIAGHIRADEPFRVSEWR